MKLDERQALSNIKKFPSYKGRQNVNNNKNFLNKKNLITGYFYKKNNSDLKPSSNDI